MFVSFTKTLKKMSGFRLGFNADVKHVFIGAKLRDLAICVFVHFVVREVLIQAPVNVPLLIAAFPNVDIHVRKSANYVADRLKRHVVCDLLHFHIE